MKPTVVLDTEYKPDSGAIFWIGLTFDGHKVYGMPWEYQYVEVVRQICEDEGIEKVGQNIIADIRVLANAGVQVRGQLYDTMLAHYCLYPGLDVGLDHLARFWLKDVRNWKGMEHHDPKYNALDVAYTGAIRDAQLEEVARRPVSPLAEIEARCRLIPVIKQMEEQGMRVDVPVQRGLIAKLKGEIEETERTIDETVKGLWQGRVDRAALDYQIRDNWALALKQQGVGQCPKHPKFNGLRRPAKCPNCHLIYDQSADLRGKYEAAKKDKGKAKTKVTRWQMGFKWGSPEHLGWLLYDALELPEQLNRKTGRRTTDAKTIDDLATKIDEARTGGKTRSKYYVSEESWRVIEQIKAVQGKAKAISTFLDLPLTDDGYLRWPNLSYKINGTVTGRLAGGEEKGGDEDKMRAEGHSLMNIPKEWRRIYIPPPHHAFINIDAQNQEGRAYAWLTQDANYLKMLGEELTGGYKVHALTAALIYGIDPADAKRVKVSYKGVELTAYDGGKRARHAWSYAYRPVGMLVGNYGFTVADAATAVSILDGAHPQVKAYKERIVREVLGEYAIDVGRTGTPRAALVKPGRKFYANPFGWQFTFSGVGKVITDPVTGKKEAVPVQANEVLAMGPQSIGASTWCRVARQLFDEGMPPITGQYDSVLLACPKDSGALREWVERALRVLEQPWPQMGGYAFKWEPSVGMNWGEYHMHDAVCMADPDRPCTMAENPEGLEVWHG